MKALWEAKTTTLVILVIGAMVVAGAVGFGRLISTLSSAIDRHIQQSEEQAKDSTELLQEIKLLRGLLEAKAKAEQEAAMTKKPKAPNLAKKRGTRSEVREFQLAGERAFTLAQTDYDRLEGRWP